MSEHRQIGAAPTVQPGEIWLVEQSAASALSALDRGAVGSANVVIYDPALASLVEPSLPLGAYGERLSVAAEGGGSAISARALRFAEEGWSVVQVVESHPGWRRQVHGAAGGLARPHGSGELPVVVIAKGAGRQRRREACVCNLPSLIDELGDADPLTVIFRPLGAHDAAPGQTFTANGLAG